MGKGLFLFTVHYCREGKAKENETVDHIVSAVKRKQAISAGPQLAFIFIFRS